MSDVKPSCLDSSMRRLFQLLLLIALLLATRQEDAEVALKTFLSAHSSSLEEQQCYDPTSYNTGGDYLEGKWRAILPPGLPTLVFPFCADSDSMGNIMGMYYNEASCARIIGSHFVMNRKPYPVFKRARQASGDPRVFFDALPTVVINKDVRDESWVRMALSSNGTEQSGGLCGCVHYCWQEKTAPWLKNLAWIRNIAKNSVEALMNTVDIGQGTFVTQHDNSTSSVDKFHSLVPDVVVHYRCGDNLRFGSSGYGLMSFPAFFDKIPTNSTSIYVLSESVTRVGAKPQYDFSGHCRRILGWLHKNLTEAFPNATILSLRGGDMFLDIIRISFAKITICSASTFCFYMALGARGKVYYPRTKLIAAGDDDPSVRNFSFKSIGLQFEWLDTHLLELPIYHPWYSIEYALTGRPFLPEDQVGRILQGNGKRLWFIYKTPQNTFKRRRILSTDDLVSLGMHWSHIWVLTDRFINLYEEDPVPMKPYDDLTIKYHFHVETSRYMCARCPPPYNSSFWVQESRPDSGVQVTEINTSADSGVIKSTGGPFGCRWKTPYVFACD